MKLLKMNLLAAAGACLMSSTASANVADLNAKLNAELKRADKMIQRLDKFIAEKPPLCPDAFREDFEHVRRKLEIDAEELGGAELDAAMMDEVKRGTRSW